MDSMEKIPVKPVLSIQAAAGQTPCHIMARKALDAFPVKFSRKARPYRRNSASAAGVILLVNANRNLVSLLLILQTSCMHYHLHMFAVRPYAYCPIKVIKSAFGILCIIGFVRF